MEELLRGKGVSEREGVLVTRDREAWGKLVDGAGSEVTEIS